MLQLVLRGRGAAGKRLSTPLTTLAAHLTAHQQVCLHGRLPAQASRRRSMRTCMASSASWCAASRSTASRCAVASACCTAAACSRLSASAC